MLQALILAFLFEGGNERLATTYAGSVRKVLYQHLAETNIETLEACDFKRIVTTDPHSFNTLKNEYPEFGPQYEVEHASTLIRQLLANGDLRLKKKLRQFH